MAERAIVTTTQRNKKLLVSGTERIRGKSLDGHGFRRMQEIVKGHFEIWDGAPKKYDELMTVLLDYLRTFHQDAKLSQMPVSKGSALKAQALGLVRTLLAAQRKMAGRWYTSVLLAVLVCRRGVDGSDHVLADLHRTVEDIIKQSTAATCIDSIVDFLSAEPYKEQTRRRCQPIDLHGPRHAPSPPQLPFTNRRHT